MFPAGLHKHIPPQRTYRCPHWRHQRPYWQDWAQYQGGWSVLFIWAGRHWCQSFQNPILRYTVGQQSVDRNTAPHSAWNDRWIEPLLVGALVGHLNFKWILVKKNIIRVEIKTHHQSDKIRPRRVIFKYIQFFKGWRICWPFNCFDEGKMSLQNVGDINFWFALLYWHKHWNFNRVIFKLIYYLLFIILYFLVGIESEYLRRICHKLLFNNHWNNKL